MVACDYHTQIVWGNETYGRRNNDPQNDPEINHARTLARARIRGKIAALDCDLEIGEFRRRQLSISKERDIQEEEAMGAI